MVPPELAVIGAGVAGLSAAVTAARAGISVTVFDEMPCVGGQYVSGAAQPGRDGPGAGEWCTPWERRGHKLLDELGALNVDVRTETLVWSLSPDLRLALYGPRGVESFQAQAVVVATGARESVVPFPGWTLPGVMTVGAAQLLAKRHGVLPGRRILLAGSGPLLMAAACRLAEHGAQVVGVLEATRPAAWLPHAPAVWGNWERLQEGWHYVSVMRRAHIPYQFGKTAVAALGADELEAVETATLDRTGRPVAGSRETIVADTLCLGFALIPNVELTQLAGCAQRHDPARGGWVPIVDGGQETSVPGLFAVGEAAGIGGAVVGMVEGELAGLEIACRMGRCRETESTARRNELAAADRRLRRFGAMLNTLCAAPPALDAMIGDATPICRCEEVTAGEIRAAIAQGATTLDALKTWTRAGQGPCQGRTCGPLLARMVARHGARSVAASGGFRPRPPLKPVPLGDLARGGPL